MLVGNLDLPSPRCGTLVGREVAVRDDRRVDLDLFSCYGVDEWLEEKTIEPAVSFGEPRPTSRLTKMALKARDAMNGRLLISARPRRSARRY